MLTKITLALLCALSLFVAVRFDATHVRSSPDGQPSQGSRLRLLTWNIGYAELEDDTRAHDKDLPAVADVILKLDPDAVALQELRGDDQLRALLRLLRGHYRGATAQAAGTDRVEAVLVKDASARFEQVPAGAKYAVAATFRAGTGAGANANDSQRELVLVSAHADAFSAARRRDYVERVVDWSRGRAGSTPLFVAGDFNFELDTRDQSHLYTDNLKNDSEAYSYLLKYFRDTARCAGDTAINDRRIDYVFATPDAARVTRAEVLRGAPVGRMDHCPLVVEVSL
jgi:endonuclease/exonuclease/phosphatase family metal-dependent hydrolase